MGEVALRRNQAGIETVRGVANVTPITRRLYGKMTMSKTAETRFAVEDRGSFTSNFRGNPKLIEAGWKFESDLLPEDMPWWIAAVFNGNVAPVAGSGAATGTYTWSAVPDQTSDTLKTMTFESGDETVGWRATYGIADTMEVTLALDDAIKVTLDGFCKDWAAIPAPINALAGVYAAGTAYNAGDLVTAAGVVYMSNRSANTGNAPATSPAWWTPMQLPYTATPADRVVESIMGWQARLFLDAAPVGSQAAPTPGTTPLLGRFVSGTWKYAMNNKRKYYGDAGQTFARIGRGKRVNTCSIGLEALDFQQYNLWVNSQVVALRIQLVGTDILGGVGNPKVINFDFLGKWKNANQGERETNTIFNMELDTTYDVGQATDAAVSCVNGIATLTP